MFQSNSATGTKSSYVKTFCSCSRFTFCFVNAFFWFLKYYFECFFCGLFFSKLKSKFDLHKRIFSHFVQLWFSQQVNNQTVLWFWFFLRHGFHFLETYVCFLLLLFLACKGYIFFVVFLRKQKKFKLKFFNFFIVVCYSVCSW